MYLRKHLLLILLLLAACQDRASLPAATITPLLPTATPTLAPTPLPTPTPGQHPYSFEVRYKLTQDIEQTARFSILLYLPAAYYQEPEHTWPAILFLHGSGEAGTDLGLLLQTGLPTKLAHETDFPFIVISPQIPAPPANQYSATGNDPQAYLETYGWKPHLARLERMLDYLQGVLRIDPQRTYLTGLSLGGFGAWAYTLHYPDRFAAMLPIAGGYRFGDDQLPRNLCDLKDLPMWVFHGKLDQVVDYRRSQVMVDGLRACGAEVRFTLVEEAGHDVWTEAYDDPELWKWLLEQPVSK